MGLTVRLAVILGVLVALVQVPLQSALAVSCGDSQRVASIDKTSGGSVVNNVYGVTAKIKIVNAGLGSCSGSPSRQTYVFISPHINSSTGDTERFGYNEFPCNPGSGHCFDLSWFGTKDGVGRCSGTDTLSSSHVGDTLGFRIYSTTDNEWHRQINYYNGNGWIDEGMCLADDNSATDLEGWVNTVYDVSLTEDFSNLQHDTAATGQNWVAWPNVRCLEDSAAGWIFDRTASDAFSVSSGSGSC